LKGEVVEIEDSSLLERGHLPGRRRQLGLLEPKDLSDAVTGAKVNRDTGQLDWRSVLLADGEVLDERRRQTPTSVDFVQIESVLPWMKAHIQGSCGCPHEE
jgi:hypothetical protein